MASTLIEALDDDRLDRLVAQTVASGQSIGTLNFSLRALGQEDEALLSAFERKMGAERYLRLLDASGNVPILLRVLQNSTSRMASTLIEALDDDRLDRLVAQTVASGHSIGTLGLSLRELGQEDEALLSAFERKMGAERYLRLLDASGNVRTLLRFLENSTSRMASTLIEALDDDRLDRLVAQTVASGHSIGTLGLSLRELGQEDEALLGAFERKMGAERYLRLLDASGNVRTLLRFLENSTSRMASTLIEALDDDRLDRLVAQTVASGQSIGTLDLSLRFLKYRDETRLALLENKIGTGSQPATAEVLRHCAGLATNRTSFQYSARRVHSPGTRRRDAGKLNGTYNRVLPGSWALTIFRRRLFRSDSFRCFRITA